MELIPAKKCSLQLFEMDVHYKLKVLVSCLWLQSKQLNCTQQNVSK